MALPHLVLFGIDFVKFSIDFTNFYALYLAISISLNLEYGYAGIPNFGKVMFIACSGWGRGRTSSHSTQQS